MQRRRILISLNGPWGSDKSPVYIQARIDFPPLYPDQAAPTVTFERTVALEDNIFAKAKSEISSITASFLASQRSSLEAILRYLLGEQSLEQILFLLKQRQKNVDLDCTAEPNFSSSEEDDEILQQYPTGPFSDDVGGSDSFFNRSIQQNSPPVPRACGAFWAEDGRLVCFFPPKPDRERSLPELNIKLGDRLPRNRKFVSEGFGRFNYSSYKMRQTASTLETIESDDSDTDGSFSSSPRSTSTSDDCGLPCHHLMPSVAWRSDTFDPIPGFSLDESHKSSSGAERARSPSQKGKNFISIHNATDLLPAKEYLAQDYMIGTGSHRFLHNAKIARQNGNEDLADVWLFVDLLLQENVPLETMSQFKISGASKIGFPAPLDSILVIARRNLIESDPKGNAIDVSFDGIENVTSSNAWASVKWGDHPFAQRFLINAL